MAHQADTGPILIVAGTRPEIIKLTPILAEARRRLGTNLVQWVSTGQHEQLETETLHLFDIEPTYRLQARGDHEAVLAVHEHVLRGLGELIALERPRLILVQGDTVSAFSAALAAFHADVPVAHVEAGLRTYDSRDPFPEEAYRRMIAPLASLNLAPTARAARNLRAEGCDDASICITGNTAVDALGLVDALNARRTAPLPPSIDGDKRLVFVTLHRRESWGPPLREMCLAIREIAERFADVEVVLPLHVNPLVQDVVIPILGYADRVRLVPPLDFGACHALIQRACVILTDSGGIQEEAPSYGVPVLVLRRVTERPEAVEQGFAKLLGADRETIVTEASRLLESREPGAELAGRANPFGDGHAARRIVTAIGRFLAGERPLLTADEQFPG